MCRVSTQQNFQDYLQLSKTMASAFCFVEPYPGYINFFGKVMVDSVPSTISSYPLIADILLQ